MLAAIAIMASSAFARLRPGWRRPAFDGSRVRRSDDAAAMPGAVQIGRGHGQRLCVVMPAK